MGARYEAACAQAGTTRHEVDRDRDGPMKRAAPPILITDAPRSPEQEMRSRERRYLLMMGLRIALLVLAASLALAGVPLLWLWLPLCGVGMVLLPWLAVIIANDGPAKKRRPSVRPQQPAAPAGPSNALPAQAPARTIEHEA
jgi:hypothetical protein